MPLRHYYTAADVLAMPEDGNKYEVVHGELLVSPSPRKLHQRILGRLYRQLGDYLDQFPMGEVYPGGDVQRGPDNLVIPDLLVEDPEAARMATWDTDRPPLLVIEILSHATERRDRFPKRRLYQEIGVPVYWLVDADAKVVEVWTPESVFPTTEQEVIRWHPEGAAERLEIRLEELFRGG